MNIKAMEQVFDRPTIPLLRKRVLLVDDSPQIRQVIAQALEIEGYLVQQASDGVSALEFLQRVDPDLILSDIEMPKMDGMSFYKNVRSNPRFVAVPFIFLTSHDSPEAIQMGRELGVEDYLTKPIDTNQLVKIVNARLLRAAEVQIAFIDQAYLETVNVLANSIEGRDAYTHRHVERVAIYARWTAEALGWPKEHLRALEFGARLHDIGKIIVPDHILNKPGPLTPEEWTLMKKHPIAGAKILRNIRHLQTSVPYVLYHHERWDGTGYPMHLKGRDIPLEGRLLALADVYDALTKDRAYRPARPHDEVIKFIQMRSGSHFDPDLVNIFIPVLEKNLKKQLSPNGNNGAG